MPSNEIVDTLKKVDFVKLEKYALFSFENHLIFRLAWSPFEKMGKNAILGETCSEICIEIS